MWMEKEEYLAELEKIDRARMDAVAGLEEKYRVEESEIDARYDKAVLDLERAKLEELRGLIAVKKKECCGVGSYGRSNILRPTKALGLPRRILFFWAARTSLKLRPFLMQWVGRSLLFLCTMVPIGLCVPLLLV